MLMVLSPSKTLDFESALPKLSATQPAMLAQAAELVQRLKNYSPQQLGELMDISEKLAALNAQRFHDFHLPFTSANARPALLAFKGDVYEGMRVEEYGPADFAYAQKHLRILSGLYGLLRPLDLMQPYRLEMGTALKTPKSKDLYGFWGDTITHALGAALAEMKRPVLLNLASEEYFKAVRPQRLGVPVVQVQFKEKKGKQLKIIGLFAKKARGMMADTIIRERIDSPEALRDFTQGGYRYEKALSDEKTMVFSRAAGK